MPARTFDLDCLFVHVPKAGNHYLPLGDFFNVTFMPMGLPALAEWVRRGGYATEIVHLGVEWIRDPAFDLRADLDGRRVAAIGLPLYWHYQAYDVIEVARALRAAHPEALVFLGGLTAGYFATEILASHPEIDAVVVGPGEGAVRPLVEAARTGDRSLVRDAYVREPDGSVRRAPPSDARPGLDALVYGDLSVMRHPALYAANFGFPLAYAMKLAPDENRARLAGGRGSFPLMIGRGCPWSCTFCAGNRDTLRRVNGTSRPEWRPIPRIVDDVRRAVDHGYRAVSVCFDPLPHRPAHAIELFGALARARLPIDLYWESWGLPTRDFAHAFRDAFPGPGSGIALSPDSGNEAVRVRNKQPHYTDAELFAAMDLLEELEIPTDLFYTLVLPGETLATARDTARQMRELAARPFARRVMVWTVQLEPGSPQFERPADFGLTTDRHSFADYVRVHGGEHGDTYSTLGYRVHGYFGDERDEGDIRAFEAAVQALKCAEFCFLSQDPRVPVGPASGRAHCLDRRRQLAARRGLPTPDHLLGEPHPYHDALARERPASTRRRWIAA